MMSRGGSLSSEKQPATREKATLFCPICGYQNNYTSDWTVTQQEGELTISCPHCGTELPTQFHSQALKTFLQ